MFQRAAIFILYLAIISALAGAGFLFFEPLRNYFSTNMFLNSIILVLFLSGFGYHGFTQLRLQQASLRLKQPLMGLKFPKLLSGIQDIQNKKQHKYQLLDQLSFINQEQRQISRQVIGLLIFLGLVGTFWGLLKTISSLGLSLNTINLGNQAPQEAFSHLHNAIKTPLSGMGMAFSTSLFALCGAIILSALDILTRNMQKNILLSVEKFCDTTFGLEHATPYGVNGHENEFAVSPYITSLHEQTAEHIYQLSQNLVQASKVQQVLSEDVKTLHHKIDILAEQMKTEQKLLMKLVENQLELSPLIEHFKTTLEHNQEFPQHMNKAVRELSQTLETVQGGFLDALKQELRLMLKTISKTYDKAA